MRIDDDERESGATQPVTERPRRITGIVHDNENTPTHTANTTEMDRGL